MDLTEVQLLLQETAAQFARDRLRPFAGEWDQQSHFPVATIREAAELGFGALYVSESDGGSGLSRQDGVVVFEALSQGCIATAAYVSIHNMVVAMIARLGSEAQKAAYLPRLISMDDFASYCLTEPHSGSDAAALKTTAKKVDGGYILNGSKSFISGAGVSDIYLVMARTGDAGPKGISAFVVPKSAMGLSFGANEKKMGWKSQPTAQVMFDTVFVSDDALLGELGKGFSYAMAGLDGGRLNIAACALGGAQDALNRAILYVKERSQFGKTLSEFQVTQFKLADMETELCAARALLYQAAQKLDQATPDATAYCAMAKRFVTDTAFKVANEALQLHGGYGYLHDYGVERIVRDLRVHQILEGTNEVMRLIISRHLLKA